MSITELVRGCMEHGASDEQILIVIEGYETGLDDIPAMAEVFRRLQETGAPSSLLAPIISAYASALVKRAGAQRATPRQGDLRFRQGAKQRYGYDGPVTPRLPEVEWWPLRWHILQRDEFTCRYCGFRDGDGEGMCADHVVPLSRGGSNEADNLVACCLPCNSSKGDRLLSEWKGRGR